MIRCFGASSCGIRQFVVRWRRGFRSGLVKEFIQQCLNVASQCRLDDSREVQRCGFIKDAVAILHKSCDVVESDVHGGKNLLMRIVRVRRLSGRSCFSRGRRDFLKLLGDGFPVSRFNIVYAIQNGQPAKFSSSVGLEI